MKNITSPDNPLFKQLKRLSESSRERHKAGQLLLDGAHLIQAYIEAFGEPELIVVSGAGQATDALHLLQDLADSRQVMFPGNLFAEISPVASPTGILAVAKIPHLPAPKEPDFAILLEDIQDPGNLGSILRTAAAAGVEVAYLSTGCADVWSPKTLRGGQGAQFLMPVVEKADLIAVSTEFRGTLLAASLKGVSLYSMQLTGPIAFVFGNEGAGLTDEMLSASTHRVRIPMPGNVESLNAAGAAAVCLFEHVRQNTAGN
ncbi:MAG TPA: RNA methyltransferase [Methylophilaceae bacterium]|nr:RNA methyltransferase [Methylophilaceae bacterium]